MAKKKITFPTTKISKVFLDYAAPLIETLGKNPGKKELEQALKIAATIWNATVFDVVEGTQEYTSSIMDSSSDSLNVSDLFLQLIDRKRNEFAHDLRLIGDFVIRVDQGEWFLKVDARDPTS